MHNDSLSIEVEHWATVTKIISKLTGIKVTLTK